MAEYGRGGVAQTTAAQKGVGREAYQFSPRTAEDYLSGDELVAYNSIKDKLATSAPGRNKKGQIINYNAWKSSQIDLLDKAKRLRDVAASRAFSEFEQNRGDLAKPWMRQAEQGVIAPEEMKFAGAAIGDPHFGRYGTVRSDLGTKTFEGLGVEEGRRMRDVLQQASIGSYDPATFFGEYSIKAREARRKQLEGKGRLERSAWAPPQTVVTDPTMAYAGLGGVATVKPVKTFGRRISPIAPKTSIGGEYYLPPTPSRSVESYLTQGEFGPGTERYRLGARYAERLARKGRATPQQVEATWWGDPNALLGY